MCTQSVIHGVSWWSIWIVIGIILCLLTFDQLCRKKGVTGSGFLGVILSPCASRHESLPQQEQCSGTSPDFRSPRHREYTPP